MTSQAKAGYSLEEYFEREFQSPVRNEFIDGKIKPMTYTSKIHGRIVSNIFGLLTNCLSNTDNEVFACDRMLFIPECNRVYYPDLIILPLKVETYSYKGSMEADLHPLAIIEVLSQSTEDYDKSDKWRCYQAIDSLRQYFIVSQDSPYIEAYYRQEDPHKWHYTSIKGTAETILVQDCPIPLQEIYRRISF